MEHSIRQVEHEDFLIGAHAPLSARTTAIESWHKCFGEWTPLTVEVTRDGRTAGLALLGWRRRSAWVDVIRLGPQDEAGCIPSRDDESAVRLATEIRCALDRLRWPWRLQLVNLRESGHLVAALAAATPMSQVTDLAYSAELGVPSSLPFSAVVSRNMRSAIAKARNRVLRGGHRLDLLWLREPEDISQALPRVLRVHEARNMQLGRDQLSGDPAIAAYLRERILAHARERRVELLLTCIDRELAAFALCFRDGRALRVFANLASPDWLNYSAGAIANHEVIAHGWADREIDVVDWGLGLQRYKLSGRVAIVPHYSLVAFSSPMTKVAIRTAGSVRARHKALIARLG